MKTTLLALALSLSVTRSLVAEDCAPAKTLRIVSQVESPQIPAGSFGLLPKTVYRLGATFLRVEEEPDTANNIHGLIVSNAPDSWIVNLATRTGRHVVDPDPNGKVRVPLFPAGSFGGFPDELSGIEMGCEVAFFEALGSPTRTLKGEGFEKIQQAVGLGDWKLVLVRNAADAPPEMLLVFKGDDIIYALRYLSYETLSEKDMQLFSKPAGVSFVEPVG